MNYKNQNIVKAIIIYICWYYLRSFISSTHFAALGELVDAIKICLVYNLCHTIKDLQNLVRTIYIKNRHKDSKISSFYILKNIFHKVCILCPTLLTWSALYVQFLSRQKTIIGFRSFVQTIVYARLKLQTDFSYFFLLISRLHASRASFSACKTFFSVKMVKTGCYG